MWLCYEDSSVLLSVFQSSGVIQTAFYETPPAMQHELSLECDNEVAFPVTFERQHAKRHDKTSRCILWDLHIADEHSKMALQKLCVDALFLPAVTLHIPQIDWTYVNKNNTYWQDYIFHTVLKRPVLFIIWPNKKKNCLCSYKGEGATCYKDLDYMVKALKVAIRSPLIGQGVNSLPAPICWKWSPQTYLVGSQG